MNLTFTLALAAQSEASVADALPHLLGMILVILTLAVLWGVCALNATLIRHLLPAPKEAAPAISTAPRPAETPGSTPADPHRIAPEIVAVIAAAVAAATGHSHRIISIRRQSSSWEKAGRQSVISSHRIR